MRVMIDSTDVKTKSGVSARGKDYTLRTQECYFDMDKRYPVEGKIRLADGAEAWPVGEYTIDVTKSCYVDKYGALSMSEELVLVPFGQPEVPAKSSIK